MSTKNIQHHQEAETALRQIAQHPDRDQDWEIYHDPATGQMKFVRRYEQSPPGTSPVTSFATDGFAGGPSSSPRD